VLELGLELIRRLCGRPAYAGVPAQPPPEGEWLSWFVVLGTIAAMALAVVTQRWGH
jgi:hypothetical protein